MLVLDDENPGVWVLASDGKTLVIACGRSVHAPRCGDTYQLRLNRQPAAQVRIALITDGQIDIENDGNPSSSRRSAACRWPRHSRATSRSPVAGRTSIERVNGSDLGSFLDEGFIKGQRIRISGSTAGAADGDYVITDLDILTMTVQPAPPFAGATVGSGTNGTYSGVIISQLRSRGVFEGEVTYDPDGTGYVLVTADLTFNGTTVVTRAAGSFSDDGLMVGTRIKFSDDADDDLHDRGRG